MSKNQQEQCELCHREMENLTVHHLVPRQNTKRKKQDPGPTANICSACHHQIHALFDNKLLFLYGMSTLRGCAYQSN
ncbi:MAG: HNH endonuclease [Nostoc sp. DedQUE04]|uniref:HNH endonuclease n=1 Tax=Nostoc sp. DedQUE04 TaxID=3075390 RepID=UPI002AD20CB5|nr:HNH endonuclease [Nostoc sp. DedQUE04]MDZ8138256.1 HNH endonuclease [Nostoc sp. DedQUE04]